uniref:Uncharacterized protein n=1 Tax=uncultured marine group II/III euryarchaeote AD1000_45_F09 TaxID=1457776 RepID=A0A075FXH8_9EURY|nr:hypothetical protein [uncultured marine group II/III euryarchaeote AD1000_45_F09]
METVECTADETDAVHSNSRLVCCSGLRCVPRGVTAAFTAWLRRLTHPGTSVELWGSPLSHSFRSSGDLTQSGHLFCSSDHTVLVGHTGLRQVVTRP